MKKLIPAIAVLLSALMLFSTCAFAESQNNPIPAEESVSPFAGAWRMPPSPFGDDFACYVILNADGSFFNVTRFFESDPDGPYTQMVSGNESFYWRSIGETVLELHYDYHDDNGEFITELDYHPAEDTLYFGTEIYAVRDNTFVPED